MSTLPLYYQQIKESIIPVIRASGLEVAAAQFKTSVSSLMKFGEPLGFLEAQEIWKRQKVFNHAYRVRANRNFLGDTADFWYFMGLLQGDGHLNERCHRIELELTDREPLDLLQQEIQSDSKVYTRNRGHLDLFRYMIYDRFYYDYVCSLGLLPRKSINGSSLVPSPGFEGAFLHGLLDSDGSVCISHGSAEVIWYGSEAQMLWVLDHLEKQFLHPYFGKNPNNVFCVRLGNPASLVRLRKILNSRIRIPRKIDALQDFLVRRSLI